MVLENVSVLFGMIVLCLFAIVCFARIDGLLCFVNLPETTADKTNNDLLLMLVLLTSQKRSQTKQMMFFCEFGRPVKIVLVRQRDVEESCGFLLPILSYGPNNLEQIEQTSAHVAVGGVFSFKSQADR